MPLRFQTGSPKRWPRRTSGCAARSKKAPVAVRSSATAEDTEAASFAGMNETFLNVKGTRRAARRASRLLGLAVRRPHRVLPREARIQPGRHGHRRGGAAADRVDALRGHVHDRPRGRTNRQARDRGRVRARRVRGFGLGVTRPLRGGQGVAPRSDSRGAHQGARDRGCARWRHHHARHPTRRGQRARALRHGGAAGGRAGPPDRAALRRSAGHRVGVRHGRQRAHAPVAARHEHRRHRRRRRFRDRSGGGRGDPRSRTRCGARRRLRPRQGGGHAGREPGPRRGPDPRDAHDRSRLGAADAKGRGDRHRFGRDDLPRRDRFA